MSNEIIIDFNSIWQYDKCNNDAIMKQELIYNKIRNLGGRITKIRAEILKILIETDCLISQVEILSRLKGEGIIPNRSTIFRELIFFTQNGIAIKNTINNADYYEIVQDQHHHDHLICLSCNSIKKVHIENKLLEHEKQISKLNKFSIINHSLEFYGYCHKCRA